jgi:hypothetical protein
MVIALSSLEQTSTITGGMTQSTTYRLEYDAAFLQEIWDNVTSGNTPLVVECQSSPLAESAGIVIAQRLRITETLCDRVRLARMGS